MRIIDFIASLYWKNSVKVSAIRNPEYRAGVVHNLYTMDLRLGGSVLSPASTLNSFDILDMLHYVGVLKAGDFDLIFRELLGSNH